MSAPAQRGDALPQSGQDRQSFALSIREFIAARREAAPPLIGTEDDCILPAFGLLLYIAKGGKGKTTSTLDAALHLASGVSWLGFEVPRPLRILFIENEGPREPFRRKLERRIEHWPHPLEGEIFIYDEDWGQARLHESGFVERLNRFVEDEGVDLIVGDPLDTLGMEGVGSPKDTRNMVELLEGAGLFTRVAWWIPHHARKGKTDEAIDEVSGAWGGKPDALLGLEKLSDGARVGFHKLRWARRDGFHYLLSYEADTEGFEFIGEDSRGADQRDYAADIEALLGDGEWRTTREISQTKDKGGIGAKRETVERALEADPGRFVSRTGEAAEELGRDPKATLWGLAHHQGPVGPDGATEGSAPGLASGSPVREPEPAASPAVRHDGEAQASEPQAKGVGCQSHPAAPAEGCRYCQAIAAGGRGQ